MVGFNPRKITFFLLFTPCGIFNRNVDVEANAARHGDAEQILARGGE